MSEQPTRTVFRKFRKGGDILALFPDYPEARPGSCLSYQHVGQHGSADYLHCMEITEPATPEEYAPLLRELTSIGYNIRPIKRNVRATRSA